MKLWKSLVLAILCVFCLSGVSYAEDSTLFTMTTPLSDKAKASMIKEISKDMYVNYDDMTGRTVYRPEKLEYYDQKIFPVIATNGDNTFTITLYGAYTGSHWIFFTSALAKIDDKLYSLTFDADKEDRSVSDYGSTVFEYEGKSLSTSDLEMFKAICTSPEVKVRLSGKSDCDFTMKGKEMERLSDMYKLYEALIS